MTIKPCPFCAVVPVKHKADTHYIVNHTHECWLEYEIILPVNLDRWNVRVRHQPVEANK